MVSITKKTIKGNLYYYLSYPYREGGKVKLIEKSLGKEIPSNLIFLKEDFISEIFLKRWNLKIIDIRDRYEKRLTELNDFYKEELLRDFGIRFTYNTNKIEGSSLTLRETSLAINEKDVSINKPTRDINEAQGHMQCYIDILNTESELSMDLIIKWHKILFSLHPEREKFAGLIRKDRIFISGSDFVPPAPNKVSQLLNDLFKWYNEQKERLNPTLIACLMKFRFVSIHPFLDGNGRMSRLLMNYILYKNNYPMFIISAKIRKSYYKALEKSQIGFDSEHDELFFVGWFFKNYVNEINKYPPFINVD